MTHYMIMMMMAVVVAVAAVAMMTTTRTFLYSWSDKVSPSFQIISKAILTPLYIFCIRNK
jgi:hypothetical protein